MSGYLRSEVWKNNMYISTFAKLVFSCQAAGIALTRFFSADELVVDSSEVGIHCRGHTVTISECCHIFLVVLCRPVLRFTTREHFQEVISTMHYCNWICSPSRMIEHIFNRLRSYQSTWCSASPWDPIPWALQESPRHGNEEIMWWKGNNKNIFIGIFSSKTLWTNRTPKLRSKSLLRLHWTNS